MNFERVKREEADTVLKLYRSLLGTPYCVWTEEYPSEKEVEFDLSRDALFCMRDDAGNIAGVISIDDDPNVECLTCWSETMVPSAEVSRVGVYQEFQNQGIARKLLVGVMEELKTHSLRMTTPESKQIYYYSSDYEKILKIEVINNIKNFDMIPDS